MRRLTLREISHPSYGLRAGEWGSGAQTEMAKPGFICFAALPRKEDHVFLFSVIFSRSSRGNVSEKPPDRNLSYLGTLAGMVGSLSGQIR